MPNYITRGSLDTHFQIVDMFAAPYYSNPITVYYIDDEPTGLQETPWIDVLVNATDLARGESGQNDITESLVAGMYDLSVFEYSPAAWWLFDTDKKYDLSGLYSSTSRIKGNCRDIAVWGSIALGALGVQSANPYFEVTDPSRRALGFITNNLRPSGWVGQGLLAFSWHQFLSVNGGVYDPSLALERDPNGNLWGEPLKADFSSSVYMQNGDGGSPEVFYGVAKRFATPSDPIAIDVHAPSGLVGLTGMTYSMPHNDICRGVK